MKHKVIDLFAGVGGIRLGFDTAFQGELETVLAADIDKHAVKTYRANFSTPETIAGDICKIPSADIPAFDICLAGFPCQAFSTAGARKGFEDTRGTLFFEVARICRDKRPKVIFCENVKGLLSHDKGRTFATIRAAFEEIGYTLFWRVLDSQDFGLAQHRERVYMVAFRKDLGVTAFDFPTPPDCPRPRLGDFLDPAPIPAKYFHSPHALDGLRRRATHGHHFTLVVTPLDGIAPTCTVKGVDKAAIIDARGIDWSRPSKTGKGVNQENIRMLTPRERFRLQGFPDSFVLPCSDTQLYNQSGNSVSVPVITAIAAKVKETLDACPGGGE